MWPDQETNPTCWRKYYSYFPFFCVVLQSEIPRGMCAKLRTVAASNNRDHARNLSTIACSRYIYYGVILHAHPVRGESHNQRNTTGEVATAAFQLKFYQAPFDDCIVYCVGLVESWLLNLNKCCHCYLVTWIKVGTNVEKIGELPKSDSFCRSASFQQQWCDYQIRERWR